MPHAFFQDDHGIEKILAIDAVQLLFGLAQQGTAIFSPFWLASREARAKTKRPGQVESLRSSADQTASRRSVVWRPRERPPRAVARLVPVARLISIARLVKVPVVTPGIIARSIG